MARKGVGELTRDETAILVIAAKFMCALERLEADPPTSDELTAFTESATAELVSLLDMLTFHILIGSVERGSCDI